MTLADAILGVMLAMSPPDRWTALPGHEETVDARRARYASIAADIAHVSGGDVVDAARLIGASFHESGWMRDVDGRECHRGPGYESRCDAGRATCIVQIHVTQKQRADVLADRRLCLSMGLAHIKRSLATCKHLAPAERYRGLSGSCLRGGPGSRRIHALVTRSESALRMALAPKEAS